MTTIDAPPTRETGYETNGRHRRQDREQTAERLLASSAKLSFDPLVDVDWDAEPVDGLWYMQPERSPLYGTALWASLGEDQKVELTRHQLASTAASGIFFEMILMRMLLRHLGPHDPRSQHFQYGLTEVADECRHSTMFGKLISWLGTPPYGPGSGVRGLSELLTTPVSNDAVAFAGTYYVEAILDAIQREGMNDERCQPITRKVAYIHVVEEARHMRYADAELARDLEALSGWDLQRTRLLLPLIPLVVNQLLMHPAGYAAAGLDVEEAKAVAAANPVWRETLRWAARRPMGIFAELGLLAGPAMALWRRTGLV
ncbi:diiron oxygenase [Euzebya sp.]|uniref:AurF N-oxygenase family protein n=1 Tax=Euzebya sp. TaxID=1971409 RepID=UPI0035180E4C